jgi:hypothetical protein
VAKAVRASTNWPSGHNPCQRGVFRALRLATSDLWATAGRNSVGSATLPASHPRSAVFYWLASTFDGLLLALRVGEHNICGCLCLLTGPLGGGWALENEKFGICEVPKTLNGYLRGLESHR